MKLIPDTPIGKEQFLVEHNKLSPDRLQVTFKMLTDFQESQKPFLKDADWSNKLRIPLIGWLMASSSAGEKKKGLGATKKSEYTIYPTSEL